MDNAKSRMAIVAGHICLDITPAFPNEKICRIDEMFVPGRLIQMGEADVHTGGAVANTGLAMKILGADVRLMGKVGKDAFGDLVLSKLEEYDASAGMIVSDGSATSYSVVLAPVGIDRIFLHCSGANDTFGMDDIDFSLVGDAALFHFGYPPLMKNMYSDHGSQLVQLFQKVKSMGVATSLDFAAIDENAAVGKIDWEEILSAVLPYVDFFVPSVEELAYMLDRPRYQEWVKRAAGGDVTSVLDIEKDVRPLADRLLDMGAKVILIKCGAPGIYLRTGSQDRIAQIGGGLQETMIKWDNLEHFEKSYRPDRILSGTGAGDTSIAAFLCSVLNSNTWQEAMQYAAGTGASCVAAYDALSGLLTFDQLRDKINAGWEKN